MNELAVLIILALGINQFVMLRNRSISLLLSIPLTLYILFWNVYPVFYCILFRKQTDHIISDPTHQKIIIIQLLSVLAVTVLLNAIPRIKLHRQRIRSSRIDLLSPPVIFGILLIAFSIMIYTNIYSIKTIGLTYNERVQYAVSDINKQNSIYAFLATLNIFTKFFAVACIFSKARAHASNNWIMRLSILIITIHTGFMVVTGLRSYVLLPIELIILYLIVSPIKIKRLTKISIVAIMLILIILAPFLSSTLKSVRARESYTVEDLLNRRPSRIFNTLGKYVMHALDEINTKFSALKWGTELLKSEGEKQAGLSLITSSLTSPIPRYFYPNKPVPFSSNGEYSGVPYYLVPIVMGFGSQGSVVPIAPAAISLWESGYWGLVPMIMINIVYLLIMNSLLKSELLLEKTMGFYMLSMPTFEFLLAPAGWIIKEGLRVFIVLLFAKILLFMGTSLKKSIRDQKALARSNLPQKGKQA